MVSSLTMVIQAGLVRKPNRGDLQLYTLWNEGPLTVGSNYAIIWNMTSFLLCMWVCHNWPLCCSEYSPLFLCTISIVMVRRDPNGWLLGETKSFTWMNTNYSSELVSTRHSGSSGYRGGPPGHFIFQFWQDSETGKDQQLHRRGEYFYLD